MSDTASETMTMPRYEVPLRRKGAYTIRFSRNEKTAPKSAPTTIPTQMLMPARFT